MPTAARSDDLPPPLTGSSHVLVEAPAMSRSRDDLCESLCETLGHAGPVLLVTYRRLRPEQIPRGCDDERLTVDVISVRPDHPSPVDRDHVTDRPVDLSITNVSPSRSLTELGVALDTQFQSYDDAPVVCVDSVTSLVLYSGVSQALRFLDTLHEYVDEADGHAHYHVDPAAHDETVRERLRGRFETVATLDEDGTLQSIDSRPRRTV